MRQLFYTLLTTTLTVVVGMDENRKTKGYHSHNPEEQRFEEIYLILRNTVLAAFAPLIFRFLFLVYSDPDLPLFRKAFIEMMKSKFGNLSNSDGSFPSVELNDDDNSSSHDEIESDSDDSHELFTKLNDQSIDYYVDNNIFPSSNNE